MKAIANSKLKSFSDSTGLVSLNNLFELYAPLVDNLFVFDNSAEQPNKLIHERNESGEMVIDQLRFMEFKGQSYKEK